MGGGTGIKYNIHEEYWNHTTDMRKTAIKYSVLENTGIM